MPAEASSTTSGSPMMAFALCAWAVDMGTSDPRLGPLPSSYERRRCGGVNGLSFPGYWPAPLPISVFATKPAVAAHRHRVEGMTASLLDLPADDAGWLDFVSARADARLAEARAILERLKDGSPRTTLEKLELWNDAEIAGSEVASATSLLSEVHPDAGIRAAAEERVRGGRRPRRRAQPRPRPVGGLRRCRSRGAG